MLCASPPTLLHEQACISRSARGAVWGVLTCLFVLSRYKGPKIFFACGALRIPRPNFYLFGAKSIRESFSSAWFGVNSRYRDPKIFFACGALPQRDNVASVAIFVGIQRKYYAVQQHYQDREHRQNRGSKSLPGPKGGLAGGTNFRGGRTIG